MMSELELLLTDVSPVLLSCRFLQDGSFDVHYEGASLAERDVVVELDDGASTRIAIGSFMHEGESYRASAFTVEADGTLSPWDRDDAGVTSPVVPAGADEVVLRAAIIALGYDDSLPPDQQAVYEPKDGYAQVRIRVRKKGSKPFI
jgi:hypothetical protein